MLLSVEERIDSCGQPIVDSLLVKEIGGVGFDPEVDVDLSIAHNLAVF